MHKSTLTNAIKSIKSSVIRHSPEILTGLGIAGMITTTVLAVKSTPKALSLIEKEIKRRNNEHIREAEENGDNSVKQITRLKALDTVKVTWKCYIPAALIGTTSIGCLIGASSVNARRNAVLATAYKLSESALTEYKEKVIETIGEKKEQAIRDSIDKDRIEQNPVSQNNVIITGKGDTLCYDYYSKRYFKSDIDKIKKAINEINRRMLLESYVSLNEFYYEIGLEGTKLYDQMGWNTDTKLVDLHFSSQLSDEGTPCLVIDFTVPPKYNFDRFC